jgi:hypothetical protein
LGGFWLRSKPWECGVVFCLKSISWGSLAEHAIDHIALKMVYYITLCLCLTFYLGTIHFYHTSLYIRFLSVSHLHTFFLGGGLCYIKLCS